MLGELLLRLLARQVGLQPLLPDQTLSTLAPFSSVSKPHLDPVFGDANLSRHLLSEEAVGIGLGVEGQFQSIFLGL
jgi:hypothetical protein